MEPPTLDIALAELLSTAVTAIALLNAMAVAVRVAVTLRCVWVCPVRRPLTVVDILVSFDKLVFLGITKKPCKFNAALE